MPAAVPAELKPIAAFIQRADEVNVSEPIVAYWCTYYAVQVGITLGAKGADARKYLADLLGKLELMKADIAVDAATKEVIEHEIQSAAYVETFALKVFNLADNIDRSGKATRATAKQFLAAANFLEVLNVFDQAVREDSYDDKIRYAKWKAADIARAFREGRKPTPGPAGGLDADPESSLANLSTPNSQAGGVNMDELSAPTPQPPAVNQSNISDTLATSEAQITPASGYETNLPVPTDPRAPDAEASEDGWRPIVENEQLVAAEARAPVGRADSTAAIVDGDTSATSLPHASANAQALGLSASYSDKIESVPSAPAPSRPMTSVDEDAPTPFPAPSAPAETPADTPIPIQPVTPLPPGFVATSSTPLPTISTSNAIGVPPPPILYAQQPNTLPVSPPVPILPIHQTSVPSAPPPPPDLTPQLIAKIQRHCRFAISSLDYEDGDQARKELRAALALLGG